MEQKLDTKEEFSMVKRAKSFTYAGRWSNHLCSIYPKMKLKSDYNRGFVGLLALLIIVGVIIYLMAQQYEDFARSRVRPGDVNTPIDRAEAAREMLEGRNRGL